jgi:hypothetical protein
VAGTTSWAKELIDVVLDLAESSMLPMDSVLDINAHVLLSPNLIQQAELWTGSVSVSLANMRTICFNIQENFEEDPQFEMLLLYLSRYAKRLSTMRSGYEHLATMSTLARKHPYFFSNGAELYWPHDTLKSGYTQAGLRRIIMAHMDFMEWMVRLQQEQFEVIVQEDAILISHAWLCTIGWQLRLQGESKAFPEFIAVSDRDFMAKIPVSWRLVMLEVNWDIFDASKKLTLGSINTAEAKTDETRHMWKAVLGDLQALMDYRSHLLVGQHLSADKDLEIVRVPARLEDKHGAPVVVVWLAPVVAPKGKDDDPWGHRNVRQRADDSGSSSSWYGSRWSQQQW